MKSPSEPRAQVELGARLICGRDRASGAPIDTAWMPPMLASDQVEIDGAGRRLRRSCGRLRKRRRRRDYIGDLKRAH